MGRSGQSISATIPEGRIDFSEDLKTNTNGALKTAVDILGVAASMTQNVPYIGMVSSALAELLKIQSEVDTYKRDWKAVMAIARQIKAVIDNVFKQCESAPIGGSALPDALIEPFDELEKCLQRTLETLMACKAQPAAGFARRLGARAREYLNRGDLADDVKRCHADMQAALDLFNTKLQIDQAFKMHAMTAILVEIRDGPQTPEHPRAEAPVVRVASLPPAPPVFYGRAREVDHIVDLVLHKPPARVAILGPGGIGKTSIALTVLHDPRLDDFFGSNRFFMSCEAVSTAGGVVQELLVLFGLVVENRASVSPPDILISHLRTLGKCMLCLDNFETPWDADMQPVEALLSKIAGISSLTLLITTRGADRPAQVAWTRPHLDPIVPLSFDAAIETWEAICDGHDDHSLLLIQAVDCMPLAVTLLAHLAQSESPEALWARWEHERTELIRMRGPGHRLNQVDISIKISLYGTRMQSEPSTIDLLSVICTLPQGLPESHLATFANHFGAILPSLRRLVTHLKQCSLVYSSEDGFLRVLSPVRLYIQTHHPIADAPLSCLYDIYHHRVDFRSDSFAVEVKYARDNIQLEVGNITAVLRLTLNRDGPPLEQVLFDIRSFSKLCRDISIYDTGLLSEGIQRAGNSLQAQVAYLLQEEGECLYFQGHKDKAIPVLERAAELHQLVANLHGEADCLHRLGDAYLFNDRRDSSLQTLQVALDLCTRTGDRRGKARTLRSLGRLYNALGLIDAGEQALYAALEIFDEVEDDLGKASTLETLSDLFLALEEYNKARDVLQSALTLYDQIDYRLGEANVLQNLGLLYVSAQQLGEGESALNAALDLYRQIGGSMGEVHTLSALGSLYVQQGRYEDALAVLNPACDIASNISYVTGEGIVWSLLGRAHEKHGFLDDAESCIAEALRLFEKAGTPYNIGITRHHLTELRMRKV